MKKNIVWFTGMPRSGTNWVSQFFAASPHVRVKFCPLFSYSFKNVMSEASTTEEWRHFFEKVYVTPDHFMDQCHLAEKGLIKICSEKDASPSTLLIKSNRHHHLTESLLKKMPEIRFLAIVRNPLAAIHSWLSNPSEFPADADPMKEWRSGQCRKNDVGEFWGFDDWKKVTTMHLKLSSKYPDRFFLHRYEDIFVDPIKSAILLFKQFGIKFTSHVEQFIALSRSHHDDNPRSVFKSKADVKRWQYQLNKKIISEIQLDIIGTDLSTFIR